MLRYPSRSLVYQRNSCKHNKIYQVYKEGKVFILLGSLVLKIKLTKTDSQEKNIRIYIVWVLHDARGFLRKWSPEETDLIFIHGLWWIGGSHGRMKHVEKCEVSAVHGENLARPTWSLSGILLSLDLRTHLCSHRESTSHLGVLWPTSGVKGEQRVKVNICCFLKCSI